MIAQRDPQAHIVPSDAARTGAVVLGGDYQGLGVVRSLGRRGVPLCVVDDERSIARFSRYVRHSERVETLREEEAIVATLLEIGQRLGLEGWALFPTREELVAALSRNRAVLSEFFRVTTADWSAVKWAWDKRNTYRLAEECGIPAPRTWYPQTVAQALAIDAELPLVIKPAIKENFIYATKKKAWRADTREQLHTLYQAAAALVGPGEVMIQERIPGDGRHQARVLRFLQGRAGRREHGCTEGSPASAGVRACRRVRRDRGCTRDRDALATFPTGNQLLRTRRARVQTRCTPAGKYKPPRRQCAYMGLPLTWRGPPASTSRLSSLPISLANLSSTVARAPVSAGFGW